MLAQCIILLTITVFLLIVSIPYILTVALKRVFSEVQMKLYSPFSMRGILLNGAIPVWGLSHLTIYISAIELGFSPNKFKLRLNFNNFQVFFSRKQNSLCPVNLIDGFQEPNILYNLLYILKNHDQVSSSSSSFQKEPQNQKQKHIMKFFLQGALHLMILFIIYLVQIDFNHCQLFIVSGFPDNLLRFQSKQSKKQTIMLMQCLAEYSIKCDLITVKTTVKHHLKYKLIFKCSDIKADSFNHWKYHFLEVKEGQLEIAVPFSMSINESLKQLDFTIRIGEGTVNLIPSDFDLFFQFWKQLKFNPFEVRSSKIEQSSQHEVELFIDLIKVNLRDIYEADVDNLEAKQYLLNIDSVSLTLQNVRLESNMFSVDKSCLSINKFMKDESISHSVQVLRLQRLCIQSNKIDCKTQITHDEVTITCLSEQIVLFGKIFTIINSRIRFECYNEDIYRELIKNYIPGGTLISQMEEMINKGKLEQSSHEEIAINKQQTLIYVPKKMVVFLEMKKLRHVITFDGFKYIRHHNYNQMSHQILVNKATIEYKYLKQFVVTDFTLIFSQTIAENQLSIQIKDIAMVQNEQTLTDYLDSFTLFKHLLQFESDQQQEQKKLAKKQISIQQISITLETQVITLKQLQIDKNSHVNEILSNLYFSLGKCDIMLTKMKNPKRLLKYNINPNHCLFSIESLTVRTNYQLRHSKAKQKIMVYLKDPTFVLPEIDISTRILQYIHMYEHMKNHIEAYFINVTNEKLISLKFHIKQFLVEPMQILVKIANMNISIADSKLNSEVLGFSKTVREYLCHQHKYNESQIINIIRRNNKTKFPLLNIKIQLISLQISRINELNPNEQSINKWICDFQKKEALPHEQTERLRRVQAGIFKFKSNSLIINIRDYPSPILSISNIILETNILMAKRIFGERKSYLTGKLQIIDVSISVGLGQLSGLQQINKRINQLNIIRDSHIKAALVESGQKTIWHKIFQDWRWQIDLRKPSITVIQILTGDNPYSTQKFEMKLQPIRGQSETESTSLQFSSVELKLKQFLILKWPKIQILSKISLIKEEFQIDTKIYTAQQSCILRISSWIVRYVQELGQLQKDWLLIYGIYERQTQKKIVEMQDIQSMSYIQIANLLANQKINSKDPNSIFNFLSRVQINCRITCIKIALIQQELQMAINLLNIRTFTVIKPNHQLYNKWQVIRSKITVEQVKATFGKIFTEQQLANRQSLNIKSKIDQSILNDNNTYQFVNCKEVVVNFNWYFINEKTVGLANTWIGVASINGQISKKVERYCSRILKLFLKNQKKKQKYEQHSAFIKPINKFREAVLHVVRINRRNKIRQGHIKKHNLVVQIKECQFKLVSDSSSMKLTSNSKAHFFHSYDFGQNDQYHSKPHLNLILLLPSSTIALAEESSSNQQTRKIMNTGKFKLQICKVDQQMGINSKQIDWGICQFEDISVQLNEKSKELLQNIIFLIVDLVNSNQVRKQRYRVQTQKYSQLVNNHRDRLKDKIQWKQSDLKWSEHKIFQWKFNFKRLSILISNGNNKIISAAIGQAEVDLHIFSNSKIERKVIVKRLDIINQIEPAISTYRKVLQLGKQTAGFVLIADSYQVKAFSDVAWNYFRDIQLSIEPIRLRVTDELISALIQYIGETKPTQNQDEYDQLAEYRNKTPDYYKNFCIKQMNLQLWMRSSSFIKRMEGIKLKLDQYELKEKLYTQGELFRAWAIWIAKQITRQSLDVLSQKIFGED